MAQGGGNIYLQDSHPKTKEAVVLYGQKHRICVYEGAGISLPGRDNPVKRGGDIQIARDFLVGFGLVAKRLVGRTVSEHLIMAADEVDRRNDPGRSRLGGYVQAPVFVC